MSALKQSSILLLLILFYGADGQTTKAIESYTVPDSIMEKQHSPTKATVMSALLPGLGQVYNKKYWKVPIIYAGFGILTYFIVTNAHQYSIYKTAYTEKVDTNITNPQYPDLLAKYSATDLQSAREYYRRNLEISCLLTALLYVLNIVDASVDANLFTYNINKDLSLKVDPVLIQPVFRPQGAQTGIRLSLRF